mmetsp:Transcript_3828/g.12206  ORF Transcript_3828/g.12206 Transcript_3828/m.12206 type:complete len:215 (+) Transcript_3828:928-1572(+)
MLEPAAARHARGPVVAVADEEERHHPLEEPGKARDEVAVAWPGGGKNVGQLHVEAHGLQRVDGHVGNGAAQGMAGDEERAVVFRLALQHPEFGQNRWFHPLPDLIVALVHLAAEAVRPRRGVDEGALGVPLPVRPFARHADAPAEGDEAAAGMVNVLGLPDALPLSNNCKEAVVLPRVSHVDPRHCIRYDVEAGRQAETAFQIAAVRPNGLLDA